VPRGCDDRGRGQMRRLLPASLCPGQPVNDALLLFIRAIHVPMHLDRPFSKKL
jgi:hypothetical protein